MIALCCRTQAALLTVHTRILFLAPFAHMWLCLLASWALRALSHHAAAHTQIAHTCMLPSLAKLLLDNLDERLSHTVPASCIPHAGALAGWALRALSHHAAAGMQITLVTWGEALGRGEKSLMRVLLDARCNDA